MHCIYNKIIIILASLTLFSCQQVPLESTEKEWLSIFDGKTSNGWSVHGLETDKLADFWSIKNNILTCATDGDTDHSGSWFIYDEDLTDFELKFKFRYNKDLPGNSGIHLRSQLDLPANKMQGPQVDIHPPKVFRTGLLYDETDGVKHWLFPKTPSWKLSSYDSPKDLVVFDDGKQWNELYIQAKGTQVITKLNNVLLVDFNGDDILNDKIHQELKVGMNGKIAFQLHKKHDIYIEFKDIYLKR